MTSPSIVYTERHAPIVLVIDDNSAIRDMVTWALELDGFEPAEASEGQEALSWLRDAVHEGRFPAVILVDMNMPTMDGVTFIAHLAELEREYAFSLDQQPSIIVITALSSVAAAKTLGVAHVIAKPFHVRDLLDTVRQLVRPA
ncbi:response regulator [Ktedonobacteria bacterium brp13]|nr:response regulator [Ktedonobacteria bacterium brp13]